MSDDEPTRAALAVAAAKIILDDAEPFLVFGTLFAVFGGTISFIVGTKEGFTGFLPNWWEYTAVAVMALFGAVIAYALLAAYLSDVLERARGETDVE